MYENCIQNFFRICDPSQVERHSDSSDFENPNEVQFESSKFSFRTLVRDETRFDKPERDFSVYHASSNKKQYTTNSKSPHRDRENVPKHRKIKPNVKHQETVSKRRLNQSDEMLERKTKNGDDQSLSNLTKWSYSKSILRDKVIPCLSTIFRRSHNCNKPMMIIEEDDKTKRTDTNKRTCCPYCKRQRSSKKRERNVIPLHPVYAVNQNIHRFPIPYSINPVSLAKIDSTAEHHCTDCFENNYCSSDSEIEIINKRKVKRNKEAMKERIQSNIRNEFVIENGTLRSQTQQFPSKSQLMKPYQVLTSTSCQANSDQNLNTTPSILWNSIKDKITFPSELIKPCPCIKPSEPCNPETCKKLNDMIISNDPSMMNNTYIPNDINKTNLSKFLEELSGQSIAPNSTEKKEVKKKKNKTSNICKCYDDKKNDKPVTLDAEIQKDVEKTCQENHDKIAGLLTRKYNGEILCIHNPPCILINGCLSLPPPKVEVQGNLWPVTHHKKSSFVQMCRKIKRTKDIKPSNEQSSQYHPPYADIKQCLPGYLTEKVIQSVCNHNPPCEVVHGCYKAKYDPRLHNSCIHVPSCNKVPQCLLGTHSIENNSCIHKPKCPEIPLCSRQYILLTAKESVSTQILPKSRICRHEPPCFMIPKCLANAICGDYIPVGAIPGCTHNPSCEMIPACCRQSTKEMVSVQSQYPNTSCRIV